MSRWSAVALQCVLYVPALAGSGCRVYDGALVEPLAVSGSVDWVETLATATSDAAMDDSEPDHPFVVPGCGNGQLDDWETCDIAIQQGEPGACPDGCEQRDGCFVAELAGQRCGAHCVPMEITDIVSGDGCCPDGATPESDSDCSGTCGNGVVEGAEQCDPPESCPSRETCSSQNACMVARFTGAAETCSARCQEIPVSACESGDGCCPRGCSALDDGDCAPEPRAEQPGAAGAEAGTSLPEGSACMTGEVCTEQQMGDECAAVHGGDRCHSCDCTYCATEVSSCETGTDNPSGCSAFADCAMRNHCTGVDCLCGESSLGACQSRPRGACIWEVREVAGTSDFWGIMLAANTAGSPLAVALSLLQCRSEHCAQTCGL